jgi:hypothetical protein
MARDTQIAPGKHLIKPSPRNAGAVLISVPRALAVEAGIDGSMFVGAMAVGRCLVIAQVSHVETPEEFEKELESILARALANREVRP